MVNEERTPDKLACPEFSPSIPSHLLADAAPGQKFLMERISVLIQTQKWHTEQLIQMQQSWLNVQYEVDDLAEFKIKEEAKTEGKRRAYKWKKAFFVLLATIGYPVYLQVGKQLGITKLVASLFGAF